MMARHPILGAALAASALLATPSCRKARPSPAAELAPIVPAGEPPAPEPPRASAGGDSLRLRVTIKFDPGPTYGGARWLEPPYATGLQAGDEAAVEARVEGVDAAGGPVAIAPEWSSADPAMIAVAPVEAGHPDRVRIRVKRAADSAITVAAGDASTELRVRGKEMPAAHAMRVEISR